MAARLDQSLAPVFRAMAASLGPNARPVVYEGRGGIKVAHDGAEIARCICADTVAETLFKETVLEVARELGDGTARFAAMVEAALGALRRQSLLGLSPRDLAGAVIEAQAAIDAALAQRAVPLAEPEQVLRGCDLTPALAAHVTRLYYEGLIESEVRCLRGGAAGLRIGQGFALAARAPTSAAQPYLGPHHLLVADENIEDFKALTPVIEGFAKSDKTLVIVARGLTGTARQVIEANQRAAVLRVMVLTPEDVSERAVAVLEDLAAASGAVLLGGVGRPSLGAATPQVLGRATGLTFARGLAVFEGVTGDVSLRVAQARAEIEAKRHLALDLEHARLRLARLEGRWAEITLAGRDAAEDERRLRAAQAALRAAKAGGVIPTGAEGLSQIAAEFGAKPWAQIAAATLRAPALRLRANGGLAGSPPADPAGLSAALARRALSFAAQLAGIGLMLRKA